MAHILDVNGLKFSTDLLEKIRQNGVEGLIDVESEDELIEALLESDEVQEAILIFQSSVAAHLADLLITSYPELFNNLSDDEVESEE